MVDYSKWNHIEISDDEDETHPNIDTPSLFRWRHQARVERMEEQQKEIEVQSKRKQDHTKKLLEAKNKLKQAEENGDTANLADLGAALRDIENEGEEIRKQEEEIKKKEKNTPLNVDTISKPGFAKTIINKKPEKPKDDNMTDEERDAKINTFIKENEKRLKHFGMLRKYDDSRLYLKEHPHLVCEDTANYLVYWCIQLEMEDKHDLMTHVAHQTICMQYILELAKQLDYDPRACLDSFFMKIQVADAEYKASFADELEQLKARIEKRAAEKMEILLRESEEEDRQKRLGPGGLDPMEVFDALPDVLKKCFESQDIGLLQETISNMDAEDAKYHMKRCVDSGLWLPEANKDKPTSEDSPSETVSATEEATTSSETVD